MILTTDPRQLAMPGTAPDLAAHLRALARAQLRPKKPQLPCDLGLFSDEADQLDLEEVSLWR